MTPEKIQRYGFYADSWLSSCYVEVEEREDGDWVKWEDVEKLIEAIKKINFLHPLGDATYDVRDRWREEEPDYEGSSWDHPRVLEYQEALDVLSKYVRIE